MRRTIAAAALVAAAFSTGAAWAQDAKPKPRWQPGPWWITVGVNSSNVQQSDLDCYGGQYALAFGRRAFMKLQHSVTTYEATDSTNSCDALFAGDSEIHDTALLVGVSSRVSGLFAAVGPTRAKVKDEVQGNVEDTGLRFELGWSSRRLRGSRSWSGVEIMGFAVNNDAKDYRGIAINWTIGPGGR